MSSTSKEDSSSSSRGIVRLEELEPDFGAYFHGARVIHPLSDEIIELCPISWVKNGTTYYYFALLPTSLRDKLFEAQGVIG